MNWNHKIRAVPLLSIAFMCLLIAGCWMNDSNDEKITLEGHDMESFDVLKVMQEFPSTPFIKLSIREKGGKKEVIFNTKDSTIEKDKTEIQLSDSYIIEERKGNISILKNGGAIFQTDIKKEDGFKKINDLSFEWSNTKRYLLISQIETRQDLIVDLESGKKLSSPIHNGILSILWAPNDELAVLRGYSDINDPTPTYIWDIGKSKLEAIGEFTYSYFFWSSDHTNLYQVDEDLPETSVSRYSLQEHNWTVVHHTGRHILEETLKGLSNGSFIYVCYEKSKKLFGRDFYAVKVDTDMNTVREVPIGAKGSSVVFWSYDNIYVYYSQSGKFAKVKTDF